MKKYKIMFITYGGGHVNIVTPLYRYLQTNTTYELQVLALTAAIPVLQAEHIPYKDILDYIDLFTYKDDALQIGEKVLGNNYDRDSGITRENLIAYLGLSFCDLVSELGDYGEAWNKFQAEGRKVFTPVVTMAAILEHEKPDLIIVSSNARMEKAAGIAANSLGIDVIRVQNLYTETQISYKATVCVMNDFAAQYYKQHSNMPKNEVVITGQPAFADNLSIDKDILVKLKKYVKYDMYRHKILILGQKNFVGFDVLMEEIYLLAANNKEDLFILKIHPNQNLQEIRKQYANAAVDNLIIEKTLPIKYWLQICDVAIGFTSTTQLEAALLNKPTIFVVLDSTFNRLDYAEDGIALKVNCVKDLESAIYKYCLDCNSDQYRQMANTRKNFLNYSNANERITKIINDKVNQQNL